MGECNDPNYGLSDEAAPAPGGSLRQTRLTEQVGKRNVLGAAWVSGDVGFGLLLSPSEAAPLGLPRLPAAGIRQSGLDWERGRSRHVHKVPFEQGQVASSQSLDQNP